jgi:Na+/proline symporter
MNDTTALDRRVRRYWMLFVALLAMTAINLLLYRLDLPARTALTLGLLVATGQAALIAGGFMGLIWNRGERRLVSGLLACTTVFLLALLVLPALTSIADQSQVQVPPATSQSAP